jgi:signal transduction histidine kinase
VRVSQRDTTVCIAVTDEGIGIPPEDIPHLFERFYRGTNANQQHASGMGIGLYIVKEIVSLHGGSVEVESTTGGGSTFTVCLPLAVA